VRAKVLVYPHGKGSSSGGLYILEAVRRGNAPAAVITLDSDPVSAAGFILAKLLYEKEIPVIGRPEQNAVEVIKTGDWVRVDADHGIIEILASGLGRRT
jgi:predicted aconitase with swiveling domain